MGNRHYFTPGEVMTNTGMLMIFVMFYDCFMFEKKSANFKANLNLSEDILVKVVQLYKSFMQDLVTPNISSSPGMERFFSALKIAC